MIARRWFLVALAAVAVVSAVRLVSGTDDLTSVGTLRAALIGTMPILLAGLGGLWAERAGVVNIGLEGQMILGTWGAAYFSYQFGAWGGVLGALLLGLVGGLLHAVATITFGVNHIVSGVAVNLIGAGLATFLAEAFFPGLDGGGPRQLVGVPTPGELTIPAISDGASWLAERHWFVVSDVASVVGALSTRISWLTIVGLLLVAVTAIVLWRTSFGLRLRSCGENPQAAESLGVNVYRYKYVAVCISGALAGLGGGFLALVSSSGFNDGQTGGRGYIGLAAMIFGNWNPGGLLAGALTFGFTDALRLRDSDSNSVHALLLLAAVGLLLFTLWRVVRTRGLDRGAAGYGVLGLALLAWYLLSDSVPREFTSMTPYVATLFVLALGAQRLRMPAADGLEYRRGNVG